MHLRSVVILLKWRRRGVGLKYKCDLAALVHPVNTGPWWLEMRYIEFNWIVEYEIYWRVIPPDRQNLLFPSDVLFSN